MPDNDLNTRDDNWQDLLKLEDSQVKILNDAYLDSVILDGWIDNDEDGIDYMRFKIDEPAKVSFTINADTTAKYTIYRYANGELEKIETDSLSKAKKKKMKDEDGEDYWVYPEKKYSATTKSLLLTSGDYFICVNAKDKTVDSRYNVYLDDDSVFFSGFWDLNDNKWETIHEDTDPDNEYDLGAMSAPPDGVLAEGWVGYGDEYSWRKFTLDKKAKLSFRVSSSDSTKFTLYLLDTDTQMLKKVLSAKPKEKKGGEYSLYVKTDPKLLDGGTYFFSVESTNADKGGNADYCVNLDENSVFFGPLGNNDDDTTEAVLKDNTYRLTSNNLGIDDWVGCDDQYDYRVFSLQQAARLYFTIKASDAVKFTVFEFATDSRGQEYRKQVLSVSPGKKNGKYSAKLSGKLFEKGKDYFICVQSKNAAKGGNAEYTLGLDKKKSTFFRNEDGSSDNWEDYKSLGAASKQLGAAGPLRPPEHAGMCFLSGWVGYGDSRDFYRFSLGGKAKLKFEVNANDLVKFTIYKLVGNPGSYSLKQVQTVKTSKTGNYEWDWQYSKKTSAFQLAKGDYYICVQSMNASKGGDAYYEIYLDEKSKLYDIKTIYTGVYGPDQKAPDDGWNNTLSINDENGSPVWNTDVTDNSVRVVEGTEEIVVDKDVSFEYNDTVYHNFVGQGDPCDYLKIILPTKTKLSLCIDGTDAALFSIGSFASDYKMDSFYSSELLQDQENGGFHLTMPGIMLEAGEYCISMESLNADRGGSAYYNITLNQDDSFFTPSKADHSNDLDDLATNGPDSTMVKELGVLNINTIYNMKGWVGYDDPVDYYKFTIDKKYDHGGVFLNARLQCSRGVDITICYLRQKSSGEYELWSHIYGLDFSWDLNKKGNPGTAYGFMVNSTLEPGDYYFCVRRDPIEKLDTDYSFSVYFGNVSKSDLDALTKLETDSVASVLAMPETASEAASLAMPETDSFGMTDALNFGQYADADALANASASSLADLDGISTRQEFGLLA